MGTMKIEKKNRKERKGEGGNAAATSVIAAAAAAAVVGFLYHFALSPGTVTVNTRHVYRWHASGVTDRANSLLG